MKNRRTLTYFHSPSDVIVRATAVHNNIGLVATSDAHCSCLGGDTNATSNINYNSTSKVTADAGSIIRTAALDVEVQQNLGSWNRHTDRDGAAFDGGGEHGSTTNNAGRVIMDAQVYLHAPDPELVVDQTGTITKLRGVVVKDDLGTTYSLGQTIAAGRIIEVQDIVNNGGATVVFNANVPATEDGHGAPASSITGSARTFTVEHPPTS